MWDCDMISTNQIRRLFLGSFWAATALAVFSLGGTAGADDTGRVIITAREIAEMKANKIADLFNQVPGVTAGSSSISIHGSYKVKVFLDGATINDPTSSYSAVNWDHVPIETIEQIEIIRDSGGLRYGQDASGGVVLITSKRIDSWSGQMKVYGGSQDTGHLDFNLGLRKGLWGIGFKAGYDRSEGYKINNDKEKWQGGFKASYNPGESRFLSLAVDYLEDEKGLSGQPEFPTPHSRQRNRNYSLSLSGRYDNLGNILYYNSGRVENTDPSRRLDKTLKVSELGEDLSYELATGKIGILSLGTGFRYGQASSTDFTEQREHSLYFFASQKFKFGSWTVNAGARGNFNSAFENALNPEASISYAGDRWNTAFTYSRSTNTPSFQQRYNHTSSTIPNPSLGMEKSDNFNLAFNCSPRADLDLGLTLFYNRLTDRITYVRPLHSGIGQYHNLGRVTYKGGDLALTWRASDILTLKTSYTYLEARDEDLGKWVTGKARHKGDIEIYLKPTDNFSNVLRVSHNSPVYTDRDNTEQLASYTLFGLRSEYAFDDHWSIFLEVDNLLDKTYYYTDGLLAPPRVWIVGLNWNL